MLAAENIVKEYGRTRANDGLSMSVGAGEIVGLLGENGAGKSTFLSILAGHARPDEGAISVDGRPVSIWSSRDALKLGVSIVFQHFSLVPTLTIQEQLRLAGDESNKLPPLLASRFSGDEVIGDLSLGDQQIVEIARALVPRPRFLLLDEPTSILSSAEIDMLFALLRTLRSQGTSVVLVTHKLPEALDLCDRVFVLRKGRTVDSVARAESGWPDEIESRLLRAMFGAAEPLAVQESSHQSAAHTIGPVRFRLTDVSVRGTLRQRALRGISLEMRRGEICAVVGIDGQGQSELAAVCSGYLDAEGIIELDGSRLRSGDPGQFLRAGVAYLTDDRLGEGTVPGFSIETNMIMKQQRESRFNRRGLLRRREIRTFAQNGIATWGVVSPDPSQPVGTLSGGNIQRVLLARELSIASSLLVVNKPTHGLDVHTRELVWDALDRFTQRGGSVLLLTTDIDEALHRADLIGVFSGGRLSPFQPAAMCDRADIEQMIVAGWS